jgi:hypothetical protein
LHRLPPLLSTAKVAVIHFMLPDIGTIVLHSFTIQYSPFTILPRVFRYSYQHILAI